MKHGLLLIGFLLGALVSEAQISDLVPDKVENRTAELAHPSLLVNEEELAQVAKKIEEHSWAKRNYADVRRRATRALSSDLEIPPRGGTWPEYYISPIDESDLKKGRSIGPWQWEHHSANGDTFVGDTSKRKLDYDGVVIGMIHDVLAKSCIDMGLVYHIEKDSAYAKRVKKILLAYADVYTSFPIRNRKGTDEINLIRNGAGRVHMESFQEAMWLMNLVIGADLVWPLLTDSEQDRVLKKLFYPCAALIMANKRDELQNQPCWKNTAVGLLGFFNNDDALIQYAIADPNHGYVRQVSEGVTADGFWIERSPNYHFYTLTSMVLLVEAALNAKYSVDLSSLKKMFDAPFKLATPQMILPAFNDSKGINISGQKFLYEWAYAKFRDPVYAGVINSRPRNNTFHHASVFTDFPLLYGAGEVQKPTNNGLSFMTRSRNFPDTGFGILMEGKPWEATWIAAKYDPHVAWHSQPDKLSFVLYKGNKELIRDPGVESYRAKTTKEWHKSTISHNSFLVNEEEQAPSKPDLVDFVGEQGLKYITLESSDAYEGVRFNRTISLLNEDLILIVDQYKSVDPKVLDIVYRPNGEIQGLEGQRFSSSKKGYNRMRDGIIKEVEGGLILTNNQKSGDVFYVHTADKVPLSLITSRGPLLDDMPVVIFRHNEVKDLAFAWCINLKNQEVEVSLDDLRGKNKRTVSRSEAVRVTVSTPENQWEFVVNPKNTPILDLDESHQNRSMHLVKNVEK